MKRRGGRVFVGLVIVGIAALIGGSIDNRRLSVDIAAMQETVGHLDVDDPDRIYIAAVDRLEMPPETKPFVIRTFQFRMKTPAGYDFIASDSSRRVGPDSLRNDGRGGTSYVNGPDPFNGLLTIGISRSIESPVDDVVSNDAVSPQPGNRVAVRIGLGGQATTSFSRLPLEFWTDPDLIIEIAAPKNGTVSFDAQTIIPLVKIYRESNDPRSGNPLCEGIDYVILPKLMENQLQKLRKGDWPDDQPEPSIAPTFLWSDPPSPLKTSVTQPEPRRE